MSKGKVVKNILVLTTWSYKDGLIQSSTLPYLKMIHELTPSSKIYLVTQEKEVWSETAKALKESLKSSNIYLVPHIYCRFGVKKLISSVWQFLQLWWLIISKGVSHIHCFCTPAGTVGYVLSIFTSKKLILDSYEPHAEAMVENGTWRRQGLAFKLLWWLEKKQSQRADYCLMAASGMNEYAETSYGVQLNKYVVRPCCVDLERFQLQPGQRVEIRKSLQWQDKIVCVYAGKFEGIYLGKEVFDFFKSAADYWGDQFRVLLLTTLTEQEVQDYCKKSNLSSHIMHVTKVLFDKMPDYLSVADFGFTPVKPVPSKRYCSPIKDGEYWALGLPVVITHNISDDSEIIERYNAGAVLNSLTKEEYTRAVKTIDELLKGNRQLLHERIRKLAVEYRNYADAELAYSDIYGIGEHKPAAESKKTT